MGVAGLIFEPYPPNFENQYNFWRCSNDFLICLLVSDFQRSVWSVPSISVAVLALMYNGKSIGRLSFNITFINHMYLFMFSVWKLKSTYLAWMQVWMHWISFMKSAEHTVEISDFVILKRGSGAQCNWVWFFLQ